MKATEYRLGNIVNFSGSKGGSWKQGVVIEINPRNLLVKCTGENITTRTAEGIPLTEEWLLKAGFERMEHTNKYNDDYQGRADLNFGYPIKYLHNEINGHYISQNCSVPNGWLFLGNYRIPCKYVHQLQNLYFALTGEELNFEP